MDSKEDNTVTATSAVSNSGAVSNSVNSVDSVSKVVDENSKKSDSNVIVNSDDENEAFQEANDSILDDNDNNTLVDNETLGNVVDDGDETFSEAVPEFVSKTDDVENDKVSDSKKELSEVKKVVEDKVGEDKVEEGEIVVENGVKVSKEGDSVVDEIKVETVEPGVAVVGDERVVVDEVEDDDDDEDEGVLLVGGADDGNEVVETVDSDTVGADDVKVDSIVETVDESVAANDVKVESVDSSAVVDTVDESVGVNDVKADSVDNSVVIDTVDESVVVNDEKVDSVDSSAAIDTVDESVVANDEKVDSVDSSTVIDSVDESVGANDVKVDSEASNAVVETVDESVGANDEKVDSAVKTVDSESVDANDVKVDSEDKSAIVETVDDVKLDSESVGANDVTVDSEDKSTIVETVDEMKVNSVVETVDSEDKSAIVETADEVKVDSVVDSESVDANDVKVAETVVLDSDVKVTSEGDSVMESIDVDLPIPGVAGVAVVTDKLVETPEEPEKVSELVGGNDAKVTSEEDSVVESIDVDVPIPGVAGVAVVTKTEKDGNDVVVIDDEKMDRVLEEVVDKEVVGVTDGKFSPLVEDVGYDVDENEKNPEAVVEKEVDYEGKENVSENGTVVVKTVLDDVPVDGLEGEAPQKTEVLEKSIPDDIDLKTDSAVTDKELENGLADKFVLEETEEKEVDNEEGYIDGIPSEEEEEEEETDGVIFGSSEAAKQFMEELEGGESSQDRSQLIDGQIATDSDEEDDEEDGKELFDSAALAALLKAAAGGSEGGNITFSSQDGSRLFTVERPAGLGSSLQAMRSAPRQTRPNIFNPSSLVNASEPETNLTEEERKKLEKLQSIRVKFLRLVHRLGLSPDESVAAQVLYRLALLAGRQTGQAFSLDSAKLKAMELEANEDNDLDFSVNILVIGKAGVGKSATINSIFGEEKTVISAFQPATSSVTEISGMVGGVMVRVFDTPGLKTSVMEQGFNRSVLSSVKKLTKKKPLDIVLYVDRLDTPNRDHNDIPLLNTITTSLGPSIWRSAIVTFTHGASAPPEGSNGLPLSYEMLVTQRSHVVQQAIGKAVGDMRMMSPSLMNPVTLVENHEMCRKNRDGQKVLPNGQTWRPQLLMLCYSMKILAEANSLTKPQDPYESNRKLFGFRVRSPPLPYMLSSMLQSRPHPKLGDGGESDVDVADLTDSDVEDENEEDEYDQLPPFKPLKRSQLSKLSKEQKKAYFDEYDYRVKLLQKKQWKEEVKRMKEMKKRGKDSVPEQTYQAEEGEDDAPAPVAVPLPDMVLPPSFDSDNPAYRFRFLEPTSQFLARPVLDTHGWDHDCGYDGVNVEQTLAILNRFPASVSVQVTKDKKDFTINMDSSVSAKHGGNMDLSTMAGFDIQPIGKQLAYIVRGETKFKNLKRNKTAAGMSVTFLGENVVTGFKVEDQLTIGRQYSIIGSAGTVRFQTDSAYGANIEIQRRENEYPIGQVQSTFGLSIIKWRGDLALGFNSLAQFSVGRNSKVAVRAGINNKMSGQITVKTSSSEYLSLALAAVIPSVISAYKKLWPGAGERYNGY